METIDKLTELAQKIMQVDDTEKKYRALANLQQRIVEDIDGVISACTDLIEDNRTLRFGSYQQNIYMMHGLYSIPHKCIRLLTDTKDLSRVVEYEGDTEEKRAERQQKLKRLQGFGQSQRQPKFIEINARTGIRKVVEWHDENPDNIYCEGGTYRRYNEICNTFENQLCRQIQQSIGGDLKKLFQQVCLYIALKNERAMMREELVLLGIDVPTDEITANRQNEENHTGVITGWVKEAFKAAIEAGYMENPGNGYKWLYGGERGNVRLAFFLQRVFSRSLAIV